MIEILLFANFIILLFIYLRIGTNIKEIDRYFAALDLSLRQFWAKIETATQRENRERHDEILRHLDKISTHSGTSARILNQVHNPKSIEEESYENIKMDKWRAKAQIAKDKMERMNKGL